MGNSMPKLTKCPTCGSAKIKSVRRTWAGVFGGRAYKVPNVRFYACPDCGEKVFDPDAVRKIQAHRPAFAKAARKTAGIP